MAIDIKKLQERADKLKVRNDNHSAKYYVGVRIPQLEKEIEEFNTYLNGLDKTNENDKLLYIVVNKTLKSKEKRLAYLKETYENKIANK